MVAGDFATGALSPVGRGEHAAGPEPVKTDSKGRQRFKKWLVRFGVSAASILGPLAISIHFTAAMLIASGVPRSWVLLWQGMAIVLWTTVPRP